MPPFKPSRQGYQAVGFFSAWRNIYPLTRKVLRAIAAQYHNWATHFSQKWHVKIEEDPKGRRDDYMERYFRCAQPDQVVTIIKAREPARILTSVGKDDRWHLELKQRWVEQYNFYINDHDWGPMFVRVCLSLANWYGVQVQRNVTLLHRRKTTIRQPHAGKMLWHFLLTVVVCLLLLNLGWSAAMRNLAERLTRFKPVQTFIYWCEYLVLTSLLTFPLGVYEGYLREGKYGLSTQTFGAWMNDQVKGLIIGIILGGIIVTLLFGVARRLPRTWWIWGALVTWLFSIFVIMIAPVYLVPVFSIRSH